MRGACLGWDRDQVENHDLSDEESTEQVAVSGPLFCSAPGCTCSSKLNTSPHMAYNSLTLRLGFSECMKHTDFSTFSEQYFNTDFITAPETTFIVYHMKTSFPKFEICTCSKIAAVSDTGERFEQIGSPVSKLEFMKFIEWVKLTHLKKSGNGQPLSNVVLVAHYGMAYDHRLLVQGCMEFSIAAPNLRLAESLLFFKATAGPDANCKLHTLARGFVPNFAHIQTDAASNVMALLKIMRRLKAWRKLMWQSSTSLNDYVARVGF